MESEGSTCACCCCCQGRISSQRPGDETYGYTLVLGENRWEEHGPHQTFVRFMKDRPSFAVFVGLQTF